MLANPTPETAKAYINSLAALREAGKGYTAAEKTAQTAQNAALEAARQVEIAKQAAVDALAEEAKDQAWQKVGGSQGNSTPQPGFFSTVGRKSFDLVNQLMLGIPANGEIDGKNTAPADGGDNPLPEQNQSAIDPTLPDSPLAADFSQTNLTQQMTENQSADEAEFADYQKILGAENLPETFAEFQEMKYNEPEAWKQIQWKYQEERTYAEDLANLPPKGTLYISDRQFGKKAKHTLDWGIEPADPDGRTELRKKIVDIVENCDEWRLVPWVYNPLTGRRDINVIAYLKGNDVVLTSREGEYISIMKGGRINKRVECGRDIKND